ncbi:DUF4267 domain-containing protein [Glycomyces sp. NPDC048151]|uniref:DUF4267 domain-containing protein n=1 Tax=Glycomyces sp. NPDC048151 TaxID=3364002 RepID=UPI003714E848
MLATIATVLAAVVALAVVAMGITGMLRPSFYAGFGIPGTAEAQDDPVLTAWLTVKGNRDLGSGLMLLIVTLLGTTSLAGWVMLAAAVMPICDGLTVLRAKGPRAAAIGVHLTTAASMMLIAVLLLLA